MRVTQIVELSKSRSKVYIEQEFAFVLYKGELRLYHIAEGKEISKGDYEAIVHTVLPKRAKLRAMNLLQKKSYTKKQLRDKLKEGFYPENIIEEAIEYVESYHYLDDFQYAVDYITYHENTKSLKKIEMDLFQKGIPKEIFQKALSEWETLGGEQDTTAMIQELLKKKNYHSDCDLNEKRRIYAFLLRKGYSSESISQAMHLETF